MSKEQDDKALSTADLVAAGQTQTQDARDADAQARMAERRQVPDTSGQGSGQGEPLAALFQPDVAQDFRSRWDAVQIGFVDDPRQAVRQADELVAEVMRNLAESFADERDKFEKQLDGQDSGVTENLRVALRGYRSFFERLLSL